MRYSMGMSVRPRFRAPVLLLASTLAVCASTATCDLPPSFGPEYYDSSINYIASFPLAAPPLPTDTGSDVALNSPAVWDWAWRGVSGNEYPYMTLSPAGTVGAAQTADSYTLAADEPVWRLELANLFGIGNFEGSPSTAAFDASADATATLDLTIAPINGTSLRFAFNAEKRFVQWIMSDLLADLTSSTSGGPTYFLRMLAEPNSPFSYYKLKDSETSKISTTTGTLVTPLSGSLFIQDKLDGFTDSEDTRFIVSGSESQILTVDEVRCVRADQDQYLRLLLRPDDPDIDDEGNPTLVPGQYEFSVWMRTADSDLRFDDGARTSEPYASYSVTLRMRQLESSVDDAGSIVLEPSMELTRSYVVDSSWRRLIIRAEDPDNLDSFDETSDLPVLELAISPTLDGVPDAGAVLIAAPALNFYARGF